ncbi:ORC-CDC6 family AAA ATPase [Larkinella punicea]|uniref:Uncharacterized protein n=1 Tax=Larkinella punicea TaxID=2315727 RepID=A0A368JQU6_9BACT|nr:hypothetical protein [Larkinella punicea]RCR69685.1 hypothetical protein DUE52_10070 [Larkinella punicea]
MGQKLNPFHELYVTESIGSDAFVKLFSDVLVDHTLALFKPGNVVLKGLPGTGKSMMLSLLKPSVRIAYKRCDAIFPVPPRFSNFIGAGINLIRSSVSDFGQRPIVEGKYLDLNELAVYFGDFLNYWVVKDILNSVVELGNELGEELQIDISKEKLNYFATTLKKDESWFGYLDSVNTFDDLIAKLKNRIISYRSYLNFNSENIPDDIVTSKTSIGVPISIVANLLRELKVVHHDTNIFVMIDQYEELAWLEDSIEGLGVKYKSVINKLLATRDNSVSYRIGTRPFAWNDEFQSILGTSAKLEALRNYSPVSIDGVLKRQEHSKTYLFPAFAEDIFSKRLKAVDYKFDDSNTNLLREIFGRSVDPREKALRYVKNQSKDKIIEIDSSWPEHWKQFLLSLVVEDPFSARLGEAWARQKGKENIVNQLTFERPFPWEKKEYWKKERVGQALIQIASRNRQQLYWEGKSDIIQLAGGNILAFLSLCQQIWEVWMRDTKNQDDYSLPKLDYIIQTLGVLEASIKWYESISERKGGSDRKLFINYVGAKFYRSLIEDSRMSYPGHTGFSIALSELENNPHVYKFLKEASDFGDLQERPHTTKSSSGEKRIKWYLNSMLSPIFKLPVSHTKEPLYISISDLETWLVEASAVTSKKPLIKKLASKPKKPRKGADPNQSHLFFEGNE